MITVNKTIGLAFLGTLLLGLAPTHAEIQSSTDASNPVPNQGSVIDRLQAAYDNTHDTGIVYHLARVTFTRGEFEQAGRWLKLLVKADWKMGLDPDDFTNDAAPAAVRNLIWQLQTAVPKQDGAGAIISTLHDPALVPESIAFDSANRKLIAGSLVRPRLVAKTMVEDQPLGPDTEIRLPKGVDWGVMYGIKFNEARGELWVLNNRTDKDGMHGNLSVLNRRGVLVKNYRFDGEPAVELNDLCFSEDYVYATDSTASRLYRGDISGDVLEVFYQSEDISFPNGIACTVASDKLYVSDFRGVSTINTSNPSGHLRLNVADGFSVGGIDGLYLWKNQLVGIQNYLGTPKIVMVDPEQLEIDSPVKLMDINRPEFRIPTTGFIKGNCLFYIANSSLDALGPGGAIDPNQPAPGAAIIIGLDLRLQGEKCGL